MTKVAVHVFTEASALIIFESRKEVVAKYKVRIANVVAEVRQNKPFPLLLSNFGKIDRYFPK